ncbi:MAG: hypothetical protein AAGM67_09140 [Bacteroidota bacterium]
MNVLIGILIVIGLIVGYLAFRYLRILLGSKDKNYGGIQRSPRLDPPSEAEKEFLPGSFMDRTFIDEIHKELEGGLKVTGTDDDEKKPKRRIFFSKKDVIRSYIVDALLDKPKFK